MANKETFIEYRFEFNERAFSKKEIEQEIGHTDIERLEHLLKIFIFKNTSNNLNHWESEVWAFIYKFSEKKWKNNNKYLPKENYFNCLWNKPFENKDDYEVIDRVIDGLSRDKYKIPKEWKNNRNTFIKALKSFYNELSEICSRGKANRQLIYFIIEKHFNIN